MLGEINRYVNDFLERMGCVVVPNWRVDQIAFGRHLKRLFELLNIDCVLDVGANTGQYRDFLRHVVGYQGLIVSFEPVFENIEILRQRALKDKMWQIEGYALGATEGVVSFNVMVDSEFSSFLDPDHNAVSSFKRKNSVKKIIEIPRKRLDSILSMIASKFDVRNFYLKMDTQGYDMEVISGAEGVIGQLKGVQMEASVRQIYKGMPDYRISIDTLQGLGFQLSGFFPNNAASFPLLNEFDCVMIRSLTGNLTEDK